MNYNKVWLDPHALEINSENMELIATCARVVDTKQNNMKTGVHKHTFFEMHYVLHGRLDFEMDENAQISVKSGTSIIIPPGHYHMTPSFTDDTIKYVFGFYIKSSDPFINDAVIRISKNPHSVYIGTDSMNELINIMRMNTYNLQPLTQNMLVKLLECLVIEVFRIISPEYSESKNIKHAFENDKRMDLIENYITQNAHLPITVKDVSERLNICERHLNRIVQSNLGCTVKDMIDRKRIDYIKNLLTSSLLPVSKVAECSGFTDTATMIRFFERIENCTPESFRRNFGNKNHFRNKP